MNLLSEKPFYIFCDFDGTICQKDLGDELFMKFGAFEQYYPQLQNGILSVVEYWSNVCASLPETLTPTEIEAWAEQQPVTPGFYEFWHWCIEHQLPLTVVSDGFDRYIQPILQRIGVITTGIYSNRLVKTEQGYRAEFPGASESCSCFCASCKRNAVLSSAPYSAIIVYIGDGTSDCCAAEHADIVFAKAALAAYCNKHRIPHYPFVTFFDVLRIMTNLYTKKRIKHRHQAVLRRKEAFEDE